MDQHRPDAAPITDPSSAPAPDRAPAAGGRGGRLLREVVETVLLAVVLYVGIRTVVLPYEVEGASMTPNLQNHERVLVNRLAYAGFDADVLWDLIPGVDDAEHDPVRPFGGPERGDVVVLDPPTDVPSDKPYIKRVIGLPGETVAFDDGYVAIDGVRLDESYIDGPITTCDGDHCEVGTIPEGYVFVLGDNRAHSADSRSFGLVAIDRIAGKAFFANWPLDLIGPIPHGDYGR